MPRTESVSIWHQRSKQEELEGTSALEIAKDPKLAVKGPRGGSMCKKDYVLTEGEFWGDSGPSGPTWGLGAVFSVDWSYSLGQETPTGLPASPSQQPWGYPYRLSHTSHLRPVVQGRGGPCLSPHAIAKLSLRLSMAVRSEIWTVGEEEDLGYYATGSLKTFKEEGARARKGQLGRGKGKQPRGIPTGCGWHLSLKFSPTAGRGKLAAPIPSVSPRDSGSFLQVLPGEGRGTNHRAPVPPSSLERKEHWERK